MCAILPTRIASQSNMNIICSPSIRAGCIAWNTISKGVCSPINFIGRANGLMRYRHDVDPQLYLTQLLLNLPAPSIAELPAWFPDQWKLTHSAQPAL